MPREKEMYRYNLERILKQFNGEMIPLKAVSEWLNIDSRTLKNDKKFPLRKVGGRFYVPATGLASWMS